MSGRFATDKSLLKGLTKGSLLKGLLREPLPKSFIVISLNKLVDVRTKSHTPIY